MKTCSQLEVLGGGLLSKSGFLAEGWVGTAAQALTPRPESSLVARVPAHCMQLGLGDPGHGRPPLPVGLVWR